jgi:hypothetical protein
MQTVGKGERSERSHAVHDQRSQTFAISTVYNTSNVYSKKYG